MGWGGVGVGGWGPTQGGTETRDGKAKEGGVEWGFGGWGPTQGGTETRDGKAKEREYDGAKKHPPRRSIEII